MLLIYLFRISIIIRAIVGISEYMKYSMTNLPIINTVHTNNTNNTNNMPHSINSTRSPAIHAGIDRADDMWVNVSTVMNYSWIENARA